MQKCSHLAKFVFLPMQARSHIALLLATLILLLSRIGEGAPGDPRVDPSAAQQCLSTLPSQVDRSSTTIRLKYGGWATHEILNYISSIVLREYLGYTVKVVEPPSGTRAIFPYLVDGMAHVNIEMWISDTASDYVDYVKRRRQVLDYGPNGFYGREGMFVSNGSAMLQKNRFLQSYKFYKNADVAAAIGLPRFSYADAEQLKQALTATNEFPVCDPNEFEWCGTGGVENFWMPPQCRANPTSCLAVAMERPHWGQAKFEQLARNLGLQTVFGYHRSLLIPHVQQRLDRGLSTVFYYWSPDPALSKLSALAIDFPDFYPGCDVGDNGNANTGTRSCTLKETRLWKAVTNVLEDDMPEASYFFKQFQVMLPELEVLLSRTMAGGGTLTTAEVACEWVKSKSASADNNMESFAPECMTNPPATPVPGDMVFDPFLKECVPFRGMPTILSPVSCFSAPPGEQDRTEVAIKVANWNWESAQLSNTLAEIILKEFLGYTVLRVDAGASGTTNDWWDYIPSGFYDFEAENWHIGPGLSHMEYIEELKLAVNFGSIGYTGRSAMLTFAFSTEINQYSDYYAFFENATDAFQVGFPKFGDVDAQALMGSTISDGCIADWCGTGELEGSWAPPACRADPSECVNAFMYSTTWDSAYFEQLTRNFNLKIVHTYLLDEVYSVLRDRYSKRLPTLFYWFEPSTFFVEFNVSRVSYPEHYYGCINADNNNANTGGLACDYPQATLAKVGNADLRQRAPEAYYFMENFFVGKDEILELMKYTMDGAGMSTDEAACAWAKANVDKITRYVPDCLTKVPDMLRGDPVFDATKMVCEAITCPKNQTIRRRGAQEVYCEPCSPGEIPSADQMSCVECDAGTRVSDNGTYCESCPIGRFQNLNRRTACKMCPIGAFNDAAGLTACELCPVGTEYTGGVNGTWCSNCTAGRFTSKAGMTVCTNCSLGLYNDELGGTACSYCAKGSYSNHVGATECTSCDGIKVTDSRGMTSSADCLCPEGTYLPLNSIACEECLEGMTCPVGASMKNYAGFQQQGFQGDSPGPFPILNEGFYSSAENPLDIYQCQSSLRCPGGVPGTCSPKLGGLACQHCDDGWVWDGSECTACSGLESSILVFPTLPILAVPLVAIVLYWRSGDRYDRWGSMASGFASIFFLVLNHYQVISILNQANLIHPEMVEDVWDVTQISSDGTTVFKMQCVGFQNFRSRLIFKAALPAVVLIGFASTWAASQLLLIFGGLQSLAMEKNRLMNSFFSLVFTFFAGIVEMAFEIFKCGPNPNGNQSLITDRSIICGSEEWKSNLVISFLAVALWCLGFGALFTRAILLAPRYFVNPVMQIRWKFLFIKYREDVYWWAVVFVAKGLLLNVGFLFFVTGTAQICWLLLLLMWYAGLSAMYRPWRHIAVNFVDCWSHLCLVFVCALLIWVARDNLEDNVDGMDKHVARMLVASSFFCVCVVPAAGAYLICRERAEVARQKDIQYLRWTIMKASDMDEHEFQAGLHKMTEWDFWYITQAYRILSTELLTVHLRSGVSASARKSRSEHSMLEKVRHGPPAVEEAPGAADMDALGMDCRPRQESLMVERASMGYDPSPQCGAASASHEPVSLEHLMREVCAKGHALDFHQEQQVPAQMDEEASTKMKLCCSTETGGTSDEKALNGGGENEATSAKPSESDELGFDEELWAFFDEEECVHTQAKTPVAASLGTR